MKTFLEYMTARDLDLTTREAELLLRARNELEKQDFRDIVDRSGSLEDPFVWVRLPEDVGGGVRVYCIFGSLAYRPQQSPDSHPLGRGEKVIGTETRKREERQKEDGTTEKPMDYSFHPDFSAVGRLPGELRGFTERLRKMQKNSQAGIAFPQQRAVRFLGFWADPPKSIPVY